MGKHFHRICHTRRKIAQKMPYPTQYSTENAIPDVKQHRKCHILRKTAQKRADLTLAMSPIRICDSRSNET